jgi:hypothetical protein
MAFEVGAPRYMHLRSTGQWVPVTITYIDSMTDLVVVRLPDGSELKADSQDLETDLPES